MPTESDWIERCCAELIALGPMTELEAIEAAMRAYPESKDLAPEEAAKTLVADLSGPKSKASPDEPEYLYGKVIEHPTRPPEF